MKQIALKKIIHFLGDDVKIIRGNPEKVVIKYIKPSELVDSFALDWINTNQSYKQQIAEKSNANAIICDTSINYSKKLELNKKVLIQVQNPRIAISMIINHFFIEKPLPGIHPSAIIHPSAKISNSAYVGAGSVIGNCNIGDHTIIYSNVTIYDNVIIGKNVLIHSGAVIGTDGLGCERKLDGTLIKFPHIGYLIINDNVEIGSGSIIAKGSLSNTIIGHGTKMNVDCFIAHNCKIGNNVWLSPKANIAGSVHIMDNVTIYSGAIIREQIKIGAWVTIGMGAVVTKHIPDGETWIGNPAKKIQK